MTDRQPEEPILPATVASGIVPESPTETEASPRTGPVVSKSSLGTAPPPKIEPRKSSVLPRLIAILLSAFIALFLVDAVVCLADDSLILFLANDVLTGVRGIIAPLTLLLASLIYVLMGLTPMIPKRLFLPLALFHPLAGLVVVPFLIYFFARIQQVVWVISFCQIILGGVILDKLRGGSQLRWPLVAEHRLGLPCFSWRNLALFSLANVFVLLPAVAVYVVFCASLATDHYSDGFVALRREGLIVQARKYVREDGKTIHLYPMSHIGDPGFYHRISQSFPTNAVILMEGVSDNGNLLTNRINYKRVATSLGVAEQQQAFVPRGRMVRADVDVSEFSQTTVDFLNLAMLVHASGLNTETFLRVMQYPEPQFGQVIEDILRHRNRRLVEEMYAQIRQSDNPVVVPWGAAHVPQIAKEIQRAGFRVEKTWDYVAIRFRSGNLQSTGRGGNEGDQRPK